MEARARTAGVAAAYVTLARLSTRISLGLPFLCADEAGYIYSACSSAECNTSPRREEKAQHAKEALTLRQNAAWHQD
jgi:hypothetical protein